jgi:aldehyde:ferredoxin oxidoreductase
MTMSIGADHNSGYANQEIFGAPYKGQAIDRFTVEGKGELAKFNQDSVAIWDTGILCGFAGILFMNVELYGKLLYAATGVSDFRDPDYLWLVGERINNLERMYNIQLGFGREDDAMPARIIQEPVPDGPSAGQIFEADALLEDYYRVRGWDLETGIPTSEKLSELGLTPTA